MTKGEAVGVWNGPKKDDVIYEQPLIVIVPVDIDNVVVVIQNKSKVYYSWS